MTRGNMKLRMWWSLVFGEDEGCYKNRHCWRKCLERFQRMLERHKDWHLGECFDDAHIKKEQVRSVLPRQKG